MVENKKTIEKGGVVKGQISSGSNKFGNLSSKRTKAEQDDWEIVEKAGKLAGLGGQ